MKLVEHFRNTKFEIVGVVEFKVLPSRYDILKIKSGIGELITLAGKK